VYFLQHPREGFRPEAVTNQLRLAIRKILQNQTKPISLDELTDRVIESTELSDKYGEERKQYIKDQVNKIVNEIVSGNHPRRLPAFVTNIVLTPWKSEVIYVSSRQYKILYPSDYPAEDWVKFQQDFINYIKYEVAQQAQVRNQRISEYQEAVRQFLASNVAEVYTKSTLAQEVSRLLHAQKESTRSIHAFIMEYVLTEEFITLLGDQVKLQKDVMAHRAYIRSEKIRTQTIAYVADRINQLPFPLTRTRLAIEIAQFFSVSSSYVRTQVLTEKFMEQLFERFPQLRERFKDTSSKKSKKTDGK
jgi:hypothetical protein